MNPKKLRKSLIRQDHKGEYFYRRSFLNGKQNLAKVYLFNGVPKDPIHLYDYYLKKADDMTLFKDGEYEELDRRYSAANTDQQELDDDIPF